MIYAFIIIAFVVILLMAANAYFNPKVNFNRNPIDGIQFSGVTWNDAVILAKDANKLIFLNIYATWCTPRKKMKIRSFSNAEAGKFFNANFINVAFDGEISDGKMLMNKYKLRSYPSLLFKTSDGAVQQLAMGYHKEEDLIKLGKKILK